MVSHEKLSHLQHSYQQHAFLSTHAVTDHLVIWRHYTLYHRNLAAKVSVAGVWKAEDKNFQNCKKICSEATTAKFEMSVIFSRGRTFPGNHLTGAVPSNFINRESLGEDEQIIHWSRCNGYKHYHKFPDIAAISGVTVNDQKVWAWLGWFCFAGITPLRLFQRNQATFSQAVMTSHWHGRWKAGSHPTFKTSTLHENVQSNVWYHQNWWMSRLNVLTLGHKALWLMRWELLSQVWS